MKDEFDYDSLPDLSDSAASGPDVRKGYRFMAATLFALIFAAGCISFVFRNTLPQLGLLFKNSELREGSVLVGETSTEAVSETVVPPSPHAASKSSRSKTSGNDATVKTASHTVSPAPSVAPADHEETDVEEEDVSAAPQPAAPVEPCVFATLGAPLHSKLLINEIAWMGTAGDANSEWIEVKNISGAALDVTNYQIIDKESQIKLVLKGNLPIGGFMLFERKEEATQVAADQIYTGGLKNSDEGVRLFDASCALLDEALTTASTTWPAGENASKKTMERDSPPAGGTFGWHTSLNAGGTPKTENSMPPAPQPAPQPVPTPAPQPQPVPTPPPSPTPPPAGGPQPPPPPPAPSLPILISEIMPEAVSTSPDAEFVEFYNPNNEAVDLTGWYLRRKATPESQSYNNIIAKTSDALAGKIIPAKSFLLIASNEYAGSVDVRYTSNPSLVTNGDVILLYDKNDVLIDQINYGAIASGKSWERKALSGSVCVSASGEGVALGNGCDTGSAGDFEIRDVPEPQTSMSPAEG